MHQVFHLLYMTRRHVIYVHLRAMHRELVLVFRNDSYKKFHLRIDMPLCQVVLEKEVEFKVTEVDRLTMLADDDNEFYQQRMCFSGWENQEREPIDNSC